MRPHVNMSIACRNVNISPCLWLQMVTEAPSILMHFQTKTKLFCCGYGYRPHYKAENDHRKRSHSKTLSRVERFENYAFWKPCFLVWTEKTMLSENDVIKIDTTRHQTSRPWVPKMADRRYHVVSTSRQIRGPINWNAHASSSFKHAQRFQNEYGVVVWTGENNTKTISVDANLFENGAKQLRFRLKTD